MLSLDPSQQLSPGWAQHFQVLENADTRGPGCELYEMSEGMFQPSWICLVPCSTNPTLNSAPPPGKPTTTISATPDTNSNLIGPVSAAVDDPEATKSMRVHWAKCQARVDQYEEEVALTVEEMGHTLCYFEWKKTSWTSLQSEQEKSAIPPPLNIQQGLHVYACHQIYVYDTLIISFVNRWRKLLTLHGLSTNWLHRYPIAVDPLSTKPSCGHSKPTALEPHLIPACNPSTQVNSTSSSSQLPPLNIDFGTDPPMEGNVESDDGSDYDIEDEVYDFDD